MFDLPRQSAVGILPTELIYLSNIQFDLPARWCEAAPATQHFAGFANPKETVRRGFECWQ
jgi:hypothetical protein